MTDAGRLMTDHVGEPFRSGRVDCLVSLYVKLPRTVAAVLSGDLYHYAEEWTLNRLPTSEANQDLTQRSREALDAFLARRRPALDPARSHRTPQAKTAPEYHD